MFTDKINFDEISQSLPLIPPAGNDERSWSAPDWQSLDQDIPCIAPPYEAGAADRLGLTAAEGKLLGYLSARSRGASPAEASRLYGEAVDAYDRVFNLLATLEDPFPITELIQQHLAALAAEFGVDEIFSAISNDERAVSEAQEMPPTMGPETPAICIEEPKELAADDDEDNRQFINRLMIINEQEQGPAAEKAEDKSITGAGNGLPFPAGNPTPVTTVNQAEARESAGSPGKKELEKNHQLLQKLDLRLYDMAVVRLFKKLLQSMSGKHH